MPEFIAAPTSFVHYSDATYDYYCESGPRAVLTDSVWRVSRINKTTLREQWAAPTSGRHAGKLDFNAATDLATVAALDFI